MSRLDELPPDQRAALSLLLSRRKSYAEVAPARDPRHAVHDRAHAALAVLAPAQARGLTAESRREIGDYLLCQQPGVAERLKTRTALATSEPARGCGRGAIARELAPLASNGLPEIPPAARRPPPPAGEPRSDASSSSSGRQLPGLRRPLRRARGSAARCCSAAIVVVIVVAV